MKYLHPLNLFCLIGFIFFHACSGKEHSQTESTREINKEDSTTLIANGSTQSDTVPGDIEGIQKAYAVITEQLNQGALDSVSFSYNCLQETIGNVTYYSLKGKLRLIVHRYNEYDHHAASEHYYVQDSSLFFVYKHTLLWSFESGPEGSTKDNITEHRVYIIDQKPTRCLEKKYVIRSQLANNPSPDSVPNNVVDCSAISAVEPFQKLLKHRYKATTGCL